MIRHQHLCFFPIHHPGRCSHMGKQAGTFENIRFLCQKLLDHYQILFFLFIVWLVFLQLFLQQNHFPLLMYNPGQTDPYYQCTPEKIKYLSSPFLHRPPHEAIIRRSVCYCPPNTRVMTFPFPFYISLAIFPKIRYNDKQNINYLAKENIAI